MGWHILAKPGWSKKQILSSLHPLVSINKQGLIGVG
jgi:hypothetical protein